MVRLRTSCSARARWALHSELQTLLEHLKLRAPALVKEIGGDALPIGAVHRALLSLLREQALPRDPIAVLEAMVDSGARDSTELAEAARTAIVPDLLRRRNIRALEPLLIDPLYRLDAAEALRLRDRVEAYARKTPRDRRDRLHREPASSDRRSLASLGAAHRRLCLRRTAARTASGTRRDDEAGRSGLGLVTGAPVLAAKHESAAYRGPLGSCR